MQRQILCRHRRFADVVPPRWPQVFYSLRSPGAVTLTMVTEAVAAVTSLVAKWPAHNAWPPAWSACCPSARMSDAPRANVAGIMRQQRRCYSVTAVRAPGRPGGEEQRPGLIAAPKGVPDLPVRRRVGVGGCCNRVRAGCRCLSGATEFHRSNRHSTTWAPPDRPPNQRPQFGKIERALRGSSGWPQRDGDW
jgi:hypothetical protein